MRLPIRPLLLALFATTSVASYAWGSRGHELVGTIAEKLIAGTPTADKVHQILGSDLSEAAIWADCAKGVSQVNGVFVYFSNPRYKECQPFESDEGKARMVDYVRRNWDACHPETGEETCHNQYHYTDVAVQEDHYTTGLVGTSDHDIVHAISAAIAVLQGKPAPAPFSIKDQREALLMLAHYLGDIHEPLHVGAVYLDNAGHPVDPQSHANSGAKAEAKADGQATDTLNGTRGGNSIDFNGPSLHSAWDDVSHDIDPAKPDAAWIDEARAVPATKGDLGTWSTQWANDSLHAAQTAYAGINYAHETIHGRPWRASYPDDYANMKTNLQHAQLVKAGARLAQLLTAVLH